MAGSIIGMNAEYLVKLRIIKMIKGVSNRTLPGGMVKFKPGGHTAYLPRRPNYKVRPTRKICGALGQAKCNGSAGLIVTKSPCQSANADKRHGPYVWWYDDGRVNIEKYYINGKEVSLKQYKLAREGDNTLPAWPSKETYRHILKKSADLYKIAPTPSPYENDLPLFRNFKRFVLTELGRNLKKCCR